MGRAPRLDIPGMLYHVVNRAAERRRIFQESRDYAAFLAILAAARTKFPVELLAYCLMPNHWHLVLRPLEARALSAYMHWVTARHACQHRFTTGTAGCGHVYQGRFRSSLVARESYYWNVLRYVEANPVRANLVTRAEEWTWGSLFERQHSGGSVSLLAAPPIALPANWCDIVNREIDSVDLAQLRESLNGCRSMGALEVVEM
jgi:putative transposase